MKCDYCERSDLGDMDLIIGKMRGAGFMGFKSDLEERYICIDCLIRAFDICLGKPGEFFRSIDVFSLSSGAECGKKIGV